MAVTGPPDESVGAGGGGVDPTPRSMREADRNEITAFRRYRPYRNRPSGDSAIPESRAPGATTSPITRDCERPIDEGEGLPTVQSAKRGQRSTVRREEGESDRETPRQRLLVDNAIRRETEGRGGGELLHPSRQQGLSKKGTGGQPTMMSHGVEISIAGGVGEKVRDQLLGGFFFFFFFFFFLYHVFIVTVQELACSASYGVNKTSISKHSNKAKTIAFRLQVWQILDTSPNIRLTKESKVTVKAKQPF